MKKVLFILGTRPEAIKLAPVINLFKASKDKLDVKVCITAQHRKMLDEVLVFFSIQGDFDLNLMKDAQSLHEIISKALMGISSVIEEYQPDIVIVQGDTTTAFAGALAAYYKKVKIAHVEAGLRSNNKFSPFPEEVNRIFISKIADYHFAPTDKSLQNLINEGINENVWNVGNSVIDALQIGLELLKKDIKRYDNKYSFITDYDRMLLVTTHRRENFGKPLQDICKVLKEIVKTFDDVKIVFPVHPNPNVKEVVFEILKETPCIHLIEPIPYSELLYLMKKSSLILTDSGGIQEEAPTLGKPIIVMREETERMEGVTAGTAILAGNKFEGIYNKTYNLLEDQVLYDKMSNATNPYGDGNTSQRIFEIIKNLPDNEG